MMLTVSTVAEFYNWKEQFEKESCSSYVSHRGATKSSDHSTYRFYCNRSGHYRPEGKGVHELKISGSRKINSSCPSSITAKEWTGHGTVEVLFTKTHVGHQLELKHVNLAKSDKNWLASQLALQIPKKSILDKVRDWRR